MSAIRPAAPARLKTGKVIQTDQLPPVTIRPHFGSVSTAIDPHLVPIGLELVGEDAGERGADMLAHLGADDVDGDDAVAVDAIPDGRLERALRGRRRGVPPRVRPCETEGEPRAGHADQKAAAREREGLAAARCWSLAIGGLLPQFGGGLLDRLADADIGHAAAQIAGHHGVDVLVAWRREILQQRRRLHDLAGLAVAALRNLKVDPGLLQRMPSLGIEPFDRRDLRVGDAAHRRDAGARGAPAHMHGAGAAHADAAAEFRAGEADDVTDDPQQRRIVLDVDRDGAAIDAGMWSCSATPNGGLHCEALICRRIAAIFVSRSGQGGKFVRVRRR